MSNRLEMSNVQSILKLRQQGWSYSRIASALDLHRETVAKCVRRHAAQAGGPDGSKPTELHTGSEGSKPTEVHTGNLEAGRSLCEPFRDTIGRKLQQGPSAERIHVRRQEAEYHGVRAGE